MKIFQIFTCLAYGKFSNLLLKINSTADLDNILLSENLKLVRKIDGHNFQVESIKTSSRQIRSVKHSLPYSLHSQPSLSRNYRARNENDLLSPPKVRKKKSTRNKKNTDIEFKKVVAISGNRPSFAAHQYNTNHRDMTNYSRYFKPEKAITTNPFGEDFISDLSHNIDDPNFHTQWYINRVDYRDHTHHLNISAAWKLGFTGKGVKVVIVDDGLETQHPDYKDNYRMLFFKISSLQCTEILNPDILLTSSSVS